MDSWWKVEESIFSVDDEMKCIHMNPPPKVPSFGHGTMAMAAMAPWTRQEKGDPDAKRSKSNGQSGPSEAWSPGAMERRKPGRHGAPLQVMSKGGWVNNGAIIPNPLNWSGLVELVELSSLSFLRVRFLGRSPIMWQTEGLAQGWEN